MRLASFSAPVALSFVTAAAAFVACGGGGTVTVDGAPDASTTSTPAPPPPSSGDAGSAAEGGLSDGSATPGDATAPAPVTTCAGGLCVAVAPPGWTGPVALFDGAGPAPSCPAGLPQMAFELHRELLAPPASCACSCQVDKAKCTGTASLLGRRAVDCSGNPCGSSEPIDIGQCSPFITVNCSNGPDKTVAWTTAANLTPEGSCAASTDPSPPPAATWQKTVAACGSLSLSQGTCSTAQVCAPSAPSPFGARHCVYQSGDVACPAGPYTEKTVAYESFDDSRGCGDCSCTGPTGLTCSGSIAFYSGPGCTGLKGSLPFPGCVAKPISSGTFRASVNAVGGTCTPSAPAPTGAATPKTATTVCCMP